MHFVCKTIAQFCWSVNEYMSAGLCWRISGQTVIEWVSECAGGWVCE